MPVRIVRLGSPRVPDEGLRLGTVRRPPRGVLKTDYGRLDYYDLWLPELAPSQALVSWGLSEPWTPARWARFARGYEREMREPAVQRQLAVLAALSAQANFSVGCYCEDADHCHRTLLRGILEKAGATIIP